jgi:putative N-acetylmannosamine-6-phosphate epimerase
MSLFAAAAVAGGAAGIRANGPADIRAIRKITDVPIIGIDKTLLPDGLLLITASFESARALVEAGADMVALDCTERGQRAGALGRIREIHAKLRVPVLFAAIPRKQTTRWTLIRSSSRNWCAPAPSQ